MVCKEYPTAVYLSSQQSIFSDEFELQNISGSNSAYSARLAEYAGPRVCKSLAGKISADIIDAGTVPENYIQPACTQLGQPLSDEVSKAVNQPAEILVKIFGPEAK